MPYEVSNVLRRLELKGLLSAEAADLAHADLRDLAVELWPWEQLADDAWQLRGSLTCYDAAYVALAAALAAPLVTVDERLARACRSHCALLTPTADG